MLQELSSYKLTTLRPATRLALWSLVTISVATGTGLLFMIQTTSDAVSETANSVSLAASSTARVFPLGVNPKTKTVTENPDIQTYVNAYVASNYTPSNVVDSWKTRLLARLALMDWYQNLASPVSRVLVIQSGQRKEEVAANFTKILGWDKTAQTDFLTRIAAEIPATTDGKLYPGTYVVQKDATPEMVAIAVSDRFNAEVRSRYSDAIEQVLPLSDTLIIASLIEREAYDFEDMRYISGIIWNRLFINMRLQIDATMQYAKTSDKKSPAPANWWPVPTPADKAINSPYNTYKNAGLPPGPIANPSIDAIIAALNPRDTDCLFYFHDTDGGFHCSVTYEEHVKSLKEVFKSEK